MKLTLPRSRKLVGVVLTGAAAAMFLGAVATPAQAAPVTQAVAPAATVAPPSVIAKGRIASVAVTAATKSGLPNKAGTVCVHSWAQISIRNVVHITLAWYRLTTDWCHNRTVVTRHTTTPTGGVTGFGGALGWDYLGQISHSANCYIAAGSRRQCSGVHEVSQGKFTFCPPRVICVQKWFPIIQEWENYHGRFLHAFKQ
jgi:hypothetical protein